MIEVEVRSEHGIHAPDWKVFRLGNMTLPDNIHQVFKKFGSNFASGYHYYDIRFAHDGKLLPFQTTLEELVKPGENKLILHAIKVSEKKMPDESWSPDRLGQPKTKNPSDHSNRSNLKLQIILIVSILCFIIVYILQRRSKRRVI